MCYVTATVVVFVIYARDVARGERRNGVEECILFLLLVISLEWLRIVCNKNLTPLPKKKLYRSYQENIIYIVETEF